MRLEVFQTGVGLGAALKLQGGNNSLSMEDRFSPRLKNDFITLQSYCALVGFLPGVPAHVDHEHVLGLEWLLFPRAVLPAAHKLLLLPVDVVVVDVLRKRRFI